MEFLDIVDRDGNPTGETVSRSEAHKNGVRHRTAHVWLVRMKGSRAEILLQKRSSNKDSFPGCYDISSAGHIPSGSDFTESAIRELWEELGVRADEGMLKFIGTRSFEFTDIFHGESFHDNQFSRVYLLWCDQDSFRLQKSEIESVIWMDIDDCICAVKSGTIPNCIITEELEMIKNYLKSKE